MIEFVQMNDNNLISYFLTNTRVNDLKTHEKMVLLLSGYMIVCSNTVSDCVIGMIGSVIVSHRIAMIRIGRF